MFKEYAMVLQNMDTKEIKMDVFHGRSENHARMAFHAAYYPADRHGRWQILSVVEVPA